MESGANITIGASMFGIDAIQSREILLILEVRLAV